jgi:hypothetical protein
MVGPAVRETPRARCQPRALLALLALACAACAPRQVRPNEYSAWTNGFVYGLIGSSSLDVRDVCTSGSARRVAVEQSGATTLLTLVSLGLYTPRKVRIHCRP